jgi:hypothetical protein
VYNLLIREHDRPGQSAGFMIKGANVLYTSLAILMARLITDANLRGNIKMIQAPILPSAPSIAATDTSATPTSAPPAGAASADEWAAMKDLIWDPNEGDTEV